MACNETLPMTDRKTPVPRASSQDEPIPGYRLVERIGRGGYGEVWHALAPGGVPKAIKLIYDEDPAHSVTELRALNRIKDVRHPFLLSIERIEQRPGMLVIVTELGDCNLQEYFKKCQARGQHGIEQKELLTMLRDVADVLDYIYQEFALQHLDIKPANLLLFGKRLKVADFGLVKNIYERSNSLVHGLTPSYASPEIFDGQPTRNSDQYSLAVLYYEMLTGELPFDGQTAARLATQHMREAPVLTALPALQQPIIARALSKDWQQRFPSCTAMVEELTLVAAARGARPSSRDVKVDSAIGEATRNLSIEQTTPAASASAAGSPSTASTDADAVFVPAPTPARDSSPVPTLVIGLGGMAAHVQDRLRLRIADRLGGVIKLPHLKLMLIDTDADSLNHVNQDQRKWADLETIATPLRNSAEYRDHGQLHRRWISRRWLFNIPRNLKTEGRRPLGRLALVSHATRILPAIRKALQQIVQGQEASGRSSSPPPRVILLSSLNGGTGSGMVVDLAYAIRHELKRQGWPEAEVHGWLMHSTPAGSGRDVATINAIATLREIAHYSHTGHFYPGEPLLETPPFHGNNRTFNQTRLLVCGEEQETSEWTHAIDNVAELLYAQCSAGDRLPSKPAAVTETPTLDVIGLQQLGGYCGVAVAQLTRRLCIDMVDVLAGTSRSITSTDRPHQTAATVVLDEIVQSRSRRTQELTESAEKQAHACGLDLETLIVRTREKLGQELSIAPRDYLMGIIREAYSATGNDRRPDHEMAELILAMLDRAVGLDFGERPQDNTRNTIFDLLNSRLVSPAIQVANRYTSWISELLTRRDVGVDGARIAAEAGRNLVRDLIGVLGQEIKQLQKSQTSVRIQLTAARPATESVRSSMFWSMRRGNPRAALEESLIQHGLICLEELVLVCVMQQLRAIEAHLAGTVDQLLSLWQELKQLGKRMSSDSSLFVAGDEGPGSREEQMLWQILADQRAGMLRELTSRVDRDILTGPRPLQGFLEQYGLVESMLGVPLRRAARQVVLDCLQQFLLLLLEHAAQHRENDLLNVSQIVTRWLEKPWSLAGRKSEVAVLFVPDGPLKADRLSLRESTLTAVPLVPISTTSLLLCQLIRGQSFAEKIGALAARHPQLLALSDSLLTRIDVAWTPVATALQEERLQAVTASEEDELLLPTSAEVSSTIPLP